MSASSTPLFLAVDDSCEMLAGQEFSHVTMNGPKSTLGHRWVFR